MVTYENEDLFLNNNEWTLGSILCKWGGLFGSDKYVSVANVTKNSGIVTHECDILCMSNKSHYLTELEVKATVADLKADVKKWHGHRGNIRRLYFVSPCKMEEAMLQYVPERAGIILIDLDKTRVKIIREAKINKEAVPLTDERAYQLCRLGAMRYWCRILI